jgi:hypothetical protein
MTLVWAMFASAKPNSYANEEVLSAAAHDSTSSG